VFAPRIVQTVAHSPQRLNFARSVKLTVAKLFAFQERNTKFTNILGFRHALDEMTLEDRNDRPSRNVDNELTL